jgi:hypothetical protein
MISSYDDTRKQNFGKMEGMQDRYVGDVGDFAKYALLRALAGVPSPTQIRLAVVWCRFPDESDNNDGRHVSYLRSPEFAKLDSDLHAVLNDIVESRRRSISAIASSGTLPVETVFYDAPVSLPNSIALRPKDRARHRSAWLDACLKSTVDCDLVFFDPDNGVEVTSVPKDHPKAGKYMYWDELARFWQRGNALLIYHHSNRTISVAKQVEVLTRRFTAEFNGASTIPIVFRRGSCRVFWLVHNGGILGRKLESRAADLLHGGWSRHFRALGWPGNDQAKTLEP